MNKHFQIRNILRNSFNIIVLFMFLLLFHINDLL